MPYRLRRIALALALAASACLGCAMVPMVPTVGVVTPGRPSNLGIGRIVPKSVQATSPVMKIKKVWPDYHVVLHMPPIIARGVAGTTLAGMTEAESRTSLEGFDISNPSFGTPGVTPGHGVHLWTQIEESGYGAEYGGASGGQVIRSRLMGGTRFHGEAGVRMSPRLAPPRLLSPDDDALRVTEIDRLETQVYARVSGHPVYYDRLSYSVELTGTRTSSILTQSFRKRAGMNHAPETFAEQSFPTGSWKLGYLVGLDWTPIGRRHTLRLTALGGPSFQRTSYRLPYSSEPNAFGSNPLIDPIGGTSRNASGIVNDHFGTTLRHHHIAILGYRGLFSDDRLEIDATLGYSQFVDQQAWRLDNPELANTPATQITSAEGTDLLALLDREGATELVPGVREACDDDLPGVACPTHVWISGGLGEIDRDVSRRTAGSLMLTYAFENHHRIRGGLGVEWLQRHGVYRFSGTNGPDFLGESELDDSVRVDNHRFVLVDADNPNLAQTCGFGRARHEQHDLRALTDLDGNGIRVDAYDEKVSSLNYGMFVEDRWEPASNLILTGALRWEIQDLRDIYGETQLLLPGNVAPRFSVVYDWTGSGHSRLYATYGMYYQPLPLQLASRMFGGLVSVGRNYLRSDCDDPPSEWCVDRGGFTTGTNAPAIVPGLKGQYNHQLVFGYDHEIIEDLVLGLRWQHTELGRAVEDISIGGGEVMLANPGVAVARDRIAAQRAQCEALQSEELQSEELRHCESVLDAYETVGTTFRKPKRNYDGWTVHLDKRMTDDWYMLASYTYSRLLGDYDGFVDPINGSINLGASPQYDTPELVRNSFGPLARDVPHRLGVEGMYVLDLKRSGRLMVGSGFRLRSGVPISVRADQSYLLPRGAAGRVAPNIQWNLWLSYLYRLPWDIELEFIVRFFNVTNAKATLRVDETYSHDDARAIVGGDREDLAHAKVVGAHGRFFGRELVTRQPNFGAPMQLQQPVSAQFELKLWF
jgi:hypothetical protein